MSQSVQDFALTIMRREAVLPELLRRGQVVAQDGLIDWDDDDVDD